MRVAMIRVVSLMGPGDVLTLRCERSRWVSWVTLADGHYVSGGGVSPIRAILNATSAVERYRRSTDTS